MHWKPLAKILSHIEPPDYRLEKARERPKLRSHLGRIEPNLKADAGMARKRQDTAKRIWQQLRKWGYTGGYTVVQELVQETGT